ncbi:MAG: prolipoprotein diacylglyceryl transferase family protein [Hyphomicrobiales bacterium]
MVVHSVFDVLAALSALTMTYLVSRWRLRPALARLEEGGLGYAAALVVGAVAGGFGLGTLNLWLSGFPEIGRSILGALAGAIAAVELYKAVNGIRGSTGLIFVPAFATSVIVGRWGCFFSGLDDNTYGTATSLPWGHDFGDGVFRHPVQLYEAAAMALFLAVFLLALAQRNSFVLRNGFYLVALWYSAQRFLWEFLKPYAAVIGPFNLFHLVSAALIGYSLVMMSRGAHERATA